MAQYEYKAERWTSYQDREPVDIIESETTGTWEFDGAVPLHDGALDLVFRKPSN